MMRIESIFKIDKSFTNQVISEQCIIIHSGYSKCWSTWERGIKCELLVEIRIWFVVKVFFPGVLFLIA